MEITRKSLQGRKFHTMSDDKTVFTIDFKKHQNVSWVFDGKKSSYNYDFVSIKHLIEKGNWVLIPEIKNYKLWR